jgi:hypothetical protein
VKRLGATCRFEVLRGATAEILTSISCTEDILMIVEPAHAADRATRQFTAMSEAAWRSRAAVLLVPPRLARAAGAIVAIAAAPDDPAIEAAAAIAAAAAEELVIVELPPGAGSRSATEFAGATGARPRILRVPPGTASHRAAVLAALGPLRERLVVMTRAGTDGAIAALIASQRGVPVLVVEPSGAAPTAG